MRQRRYADADRNTFASILGVPHHVGAGLLRTFRGAVGGAIIYDQHPVNDTGEIPNHFADSTRLVERRDQRSRSHRRRHFALSSIAGRTTTDATASVTTATIETMPIDRSGG